ncbi:MAG TPA: methyltransferase domain-containing protein [Thermoanaerobaculia bacterium]|nr:methyltransferase domain-containing protein [Thermoanaerobaculia bacterium]
MADRLIEHAACRICGAGPLAPILSLGTLSVSGFPSGASGAAAASDAAPLDLVLCEPARGGCGLLQLAHTVPPGSLYREYWYRSVTNESMRAALAEITRRVEETVDLAPNDLVLDIGCNDGTLLRSYRSPGVTLVGFEPSRNLHLFARQATDLIINDFWSAAAFRAALGERKAKVVTTIAMFYDLEDPNAFVADLASVLAPDGVVINQMAYLPLMLERNAFDNICHEHLEYYSLSVLRRLYSRHGLEVFDVELNEVNGGSFRVYARHRGATLRGASEFGLARVASMERFEDELRLAHRDVYDAFVARVNAARDEVVSFVKDAVASGKRIYGYGASTKGNTLLQYFGLDESLITAIADRNPDKWGRRTVHTDIPIVSEEQARKEKPDFFLVLPWHFLPSFVERERDYLSSGGKFIVPLPRLRLIGA